MKKHSTLLLILRTVLLSSIPRPEQTLAASQVICVLLQGSAFNKKLPKPVQIPIKFV